MEAQPAVPMAAHEEVLAEEESVDFGISLPSAHGDKSGREELNLSLPSDAVAGSAAAMAPAQAFAEAVRAAVGPEETAADARREKVRRAKEAAALVGSLSAGGRGDGEAEHRPSSAPPKPAASAPPTKRATAAMPLRRDPAPTACRTLHVGTVPARPKVASGASSARRARPTPHTASAVAASAVAAMHGVRRSQTATQRAHAEVAAYGAPGPFELESLRDEVASLKRELAKAQADAIGARTAAARAQEEGKRAAARSSLGAAAEIALLDVHGGGGGGVGAAQAGLVVKLKDRVRDLERDLASRDREIADLSGSSKQARLHELQTQARVYFSEVRRLQALLELSSQADASHRERKLDESAKAAAALKEQLSARERQLATQREQNSALDRELGRWIDENDELRKQVASLEKRAASAPAVEARKGQARQLARVESELADCRAELAKAGEKAQAAEAQVAAAQKEARRWRWMALESAKAEAEAKALHMLGASASEITERAEGGATAAGAAGAGAPRASVHKRPKAIAGRGGGRSGGAYGGAPADARPAGSARSANSGRNPPETIAEEIGGGGSGGGGGLSGSGREYDEYDESDDDPWAMSHNSALNDTLDMADLPEK